MVKVRLTEQQKRERALIVAVSRAAAEQGLDYDKDIAAAIGISPQSYSQYKKVAFQNATFELIGRMARALGLTAQDLCLSAGVPYGPGRDSVSA